MNYEQLKNSILQEAIEGRLVKQDPNDEPAAVLLDRIADEKKRLIKEKKIKRDKNESRIYRTDDGHWMERFSDKNRPEACIDDEIPFDIPESWEWCRIKEIIYPPKYGTSNKSKKEGVVPVLRMGNIQNGEINYNNLVYSDNTSDNEKYKLQKGDLLFNRTNSAELVGKTAIYRGEREAIYAGYIILLRPIIASSEFLNFVFSSPYLRSYCKEVKTIGVQQCNINAEKVSNLIIPIPPLSEQHRIVAKLEELLPKMEEYGKAQDRLDALNSVLPEKLKASILQEAIEGRLVPQNPDDDPASKLLDRIAEEKAKLVKEKKIKADKNASRIYRTDDGHWMEHFADKHRTDVCIDDEIPFDIPSNWRWSRLKEHCVITSGLGYKKENLETKSDQMIRVLRGGNIDYGKWQNKVNDIFISKEFVKDELLLKRGTFISPAVTSLEQMGKTALIEEDLPETVVGGFVLMIMPFIFKDEYLHYLNAFFMSSYYKKQCQSITNKSGQAFYNLSRAKLLETLVPVPPIQEERRIDNILNEILPKLENILH